MKLHSPSMVILQGGAEGTSQLCCPPSFCTLEGAPHGQNPVRRQRGKWSRTWCPCRQTTRFGRRSGWAMEVCTVQWHVMICSSLALAAFCQPWSKWSVFLVQISGAWTEFKHLNGFKAALLWKALALNHFPLTCNDVFFLVRLRILLGECSSPSTLVSEAHGLLWINNAGHLHLRSCKQSQFWIALLLRSGLREVGVWTSQEISSYLSPSFP